MSGAGKKRVMLIGRSGCGKTTLCQYLNNEALRYRKTQTVEIVNGAMIDTPGEYLERRNLQRALLVTSADAELIVLVQDATEQGTMFPPAFTSVFAKPSVGVVTKCDLAQPEQIERAKKYLEMAGAEKVVATSSMSGEGMPALTELLEG